MLKLSAVVEVIARDVGCCNGLETLPSFVMEPLVLPLTADVLATWASFGNPLRSHPTRSCRRF